MGQTDDVTAVVLAGQEHGPGRPGRAVAPVGGRPLVDRVVSTVGAATDRPPVVVVRSERERRSVAATLPDAVRIETPAPAFDGPLGSLVGGARQAETEWLFVCGATMPFLLADAVDWVTGGRLSADDAVVPRVNGTDPRPTHAAFRRPAVLDAVADLGPGATLTDLLDALPSVHAVDAAEAPPAVPLLVSMTAVDNGEELEMARQLLP